jgi:hypothetical protein
METYKRAEVKLQAFLTSAVCGDGWLSSSGTRLIQGNGRRYVLDWTVFVGSGTGKYSVAKKIATVGNLTPVVLSVRVILLADISIRIYSFQLGS